MTITTFQAYIAKETEIEAALARCPFSPTLIVAFGCSSLLQAFSECSARRKSANIAICGCTAAGEISGREIHDNSLSLHFYQFEHTAVKEHAISFSEASSSEQVGSELATALNAPDLCHLFVLSDGLHINGTSLVKGLRSSIDSQIAITGGLAGDGDRFKETLVLSSSGVSSRKVTGIGFYGTRLKVGFGSLGGWDPFGTERIITKSSNNVLYEFDGAPALPVYKKYLGELAKDLPASGLLFPLSIKVPGTHEPLVRTLLSVDDTEQSLTFAGDVPVGCSARLMKANFSRLLDGASNAANISCLALDSTEAEAAILISCVGRRLVLKQRAEEEIEAVIEQLGSKASIAGFYSYGEIAPFIKNARCELHNQTMTITAFAEV